MRLALRCVSPKTLPTETEFTKILDLTIVDAKVLTVSELLSEDKVGAQIWSCLQSSCWPGETREETWGSTHRRSSYTSQRGIQLLSSKLHVFLFRETQGLKGLNTSLVKGLGSFDLNTRLLDPLDRATYCFGQLFSSFLLGGYYTMTELSQCHEEYLSFIDDLLQWYSGITFLFIRDTITSLMKFQSLQSRPLLHKFFRLSCLCIDGPFPQHPSVEFWNVNFEKSTSQVTFVILPVQSHFSSVARGVEIKTKEESVAKFLGLESTFGSTGLSDVYCPLLSVDFVGRAGIVEALDQSGSCCRDSSFKSAPKPIGVVESPWCIPVPRPKKRSSS